MHSNQSDAVENLIAGRLQIASAIDECVIADEQYMRTPFYVVTKSTDWLGQRGHAVNPKHAKTVAGDGAWKRLPKRRRPSRRQDIAFTPSAAGLGDHQADICWRTIHPAAAGSGLVAIVDCTAALSWDVSINLGRTLLREGNWIGP